MNFSVGQPGKATGWTLKRLSIVSLFFRLVELRQDYGFHNFSDAGFPFRFGDDKQGFEYLRPLVGGDACKRVV